MCIIFTGYPATSKHHHATRCKVQALATFDLRLEAGSEIDRLGSKSTIFGYC